MDDFRNIVKKTKTFTCSIFVAECIVHFMNSNTYRVHLTDFYKIASHVPQDSVSRFKQTYINLKVKVTNNIKTVNIHILVSVLFDNSW